MRRQVNACGNLSSAPRVLTRFAQQCVVVCSAASLLILASPANAVLPAQVESLSPELSGRLSIAGQREPLAHASIVVADSGELPVGKLHFSQVPPQFSWTRQATSDENGEWVLYELPATRVLLIVASPTTRQWAEVIELAPGQTTRREISLLPSDEPAYRTISRISRAQTASPGAATLQAAEISTMPGSLSDPIRALQNFPGIGRGAFGSAELRIRGASPRDSLMLFGEHPLPSILHFGAVQAVMPVQTIAQVQYLPGNFDARYGDAIGGVVRATPRAGRRDKLHLVAKSDILDSGAIVEGPLGKGSYLVAARRSYLDALAGAIEPLLPGLSAQAIPRYYDYQVYFDYPVGKRDELSVHVIGSNDRGSVFFADDTTLQSTVDPKQAFVRGDFSVVSRRGPWKILSSAAVGRVTTTTPITETFWLDTKSLDLSWREEIERRLTSRLTAKVGAWLQYSLIDREATTKAWQGPELSTKSERKNFLGTIYTETRWHPGQAASKPLELQFGSRLSLYDYSNAETVRAISEPRFSVSWQASKKLQLQAASGLYVQSREADPTLQELASAKVGIARSLHNSMAAQFSLDERFGGSVTAFHKEQWNLPVWAQVETPSSSGYEVSAQGRGKSLGLEFALQHRFRARASAWLAYTLMRSWQTRLAGGRMLLSPYDQTHIFTAVYSYRLPFAWVLGARFRVVSGALVTPTLTSVALFHSSLGKFAVVEGEQFSERAPLFHQLDMRVDKTWAFSRSRLTLSLDLINVYNQQNIESYRQAYDGQRTIAVRSLPILPALGVRWEY